MLKIKENNFVTENYKIIILFLSLACICAVAPATATAQTTEFTYQGRLTDTAGTAASYDFEFKLFSAPNALVPLGTQTRLGVPVSGNVFTVQLDFGAQFDGATRYLEIAVKPAGSGAAFTILTPRQPVTSAPYSVRSLTATDSTQLGGVAANQFVQTTDSRLSNARNPLPGSTNYIQNTTDFQQFAGFDIGGSGRIRGDLTVDGILTAQLPPNNPNYIQNRNSQQSLSNFNISGNGAIGGNLTVNGTLTANLPSGDASYVQNRTTQQAATNFNISGSGTISNTLFAGRVNVASQFEINGNRFLSNFGTNNTFAGIGTGAANSGTDNSFFGYVAGDVNDAGSDNSFFGSDAGGSNVGGNNNSFFGSDTGDSNTTGFDNSFFGRSAGGGNTTGNSNSFFGRDAGLANATADNNSFFGSFAGLANTTGGENSFFGRSAGRDNTSGFHNAFFGYQAGVNNEGGGNNSFFGYTTGDANTSGEQNSFFGSNAGGATTTGGFNTFIGRNAGAANTTGSNNTVIGASANIVSNNSNYATAVGAGTVVDASNTIQLGRTDRSDRVIAPGRITARSGMQVGESGDTSSIFVYGFISTTGSINVGGGAAISGNLTKGGGSFKIDHPLDPENKYLYHSFVESPDMMNIYNGNATTDANGEATVTMPGYFEALNRDFRYQLTVIGTFAQAIVAEEINKNQFKIRTDKPGVKVSWQVTGVRRDPYAEQNRIQTEVEKPEQERGTYLYPKAYERKIEVAEPASPPVSKP